MMDRIFIHGLEVETLIGVYDWERRLRQCLILDIDCAWDILPAARTDDLGRALDYATLAEQVRIFARQSDFQLLETFAERLAIYLQDLFRLEGIRLRIQKPGAIPGVKAVGLEIRRGHLAPEH